LSANSLTTEERLERIDNEVEDVKDRFVEAIEQLTEEPAVDDSFVARLGGLIERLNQLGTDLRPEDFDKDQLASLFRSLWSIRDLVDTADGSPDLDTCDELLVLIERVRHVVRDALDEHVTGVAGDRGLVVKDLRRWLPNTSLTTIAELVDVDRRTLNRWTHNPGPPSPRLALVARLVAILRHAWTEHGIVAWFDRPRRDLGGRKPRALLADPTAEDTLIMAARSGRSQYAS
jgi:hypothetical protein